MRLSISVLATAAMFFVATTAGAVEFSIAGPTSTTVNPGDSVTIDIVMTNDDYSYVYGIAASVTDYGANTFVSGQAVSSYFNTICIDPGFCFGGLSNLVGPALVESSIAANSNRVQIALSASIGGSYGSPGVDQGLDDNVGTTMFSLTFTAVESAAIQIGTGYLGDGIINEDGSYTQAQGAVFEIIILPEPGTAMLIGLGLAGLAATGRRE